MAPMPIGDAHRPLILLTDGQRRNAELQLHSGQKECWRFFEGSPNDPSGCTGGLT